MSRFHERSTGLITPSVLVDAAATVNLNDIGTGDTFTLTMTEVGTATASTTGTITFNASTTTLQGNIQTAVRAVTGYAASTVAHQSAQIYLVTLIGTKSGYDVDITITGATGFTPGAVTQTVEGSAAVTTTLNVGRFCIPGRVRLAGWIDNSLDVSIVDAAARTVYTRTALDTNSSGTDAPHDVYITADGVAGEDGAAAAGAAGGLFEGPLTVTVTASSPDRDGSVNVFADLGGPSGSAFKLRRTGTFLGSTASVNLGAAVGKIRRIKVDSVSDAAVAIAVADAYSKNIYTKSSTDFTTAVDVALSHEGVDQAGNAVADTLGVIAKSPVTVTLTGHDGTGFAVDFWVEV
jgi:hypothetical protein